MRINKESIQKFSREIVEKRIRADREILAVCMGGSFLEEDFMLGGAGDVDLFIIHNHTPPVEREIVRLTDEVHLDIAHYDQKEFRETRALRIHPWLGPMLNSCKIQYDPQHFLDFVQASVRGQYDRSDHVYQRARPLADQARETWFQLQSDEITDGQTALPKYLSAIEKSANAIASLAGPPLSERRLLMQYRARVDALERPGLYMGLLGLLGAPNCTETTLKDWMKEWAGAYKAVPHADREAPFHQARYHYYLSAFEEMHESEQPVTLLWPLLTTWTRIIMAFPSGADYSSSWQKAVETLGLFGSDLEERYRALDAYLDTVEETFEEWAQANGVWEPT